MLRFRKCSPHVLTFIQDELVPGSVISVDSFPWSLKRDVDHVYELKMFANLCTCSTQLTFIDSILDVPTNLQYDNLLLCGISEFKYKKWENVVDMVVDVAKVSKNKIIVALPITLLFFHRLKYSYTEIVNNINQRFKQYNLVCQTWILDIDIVYISLSKL